MRIIVVAVALISAPAFATVREGQAIRLVAETMHRLDPMPSHCLLYDTETRSRRALEIAVRENHERGCGGDPDVSPVIERFRILRSPVSLWRWDAATDTYHRCRVSPGRPPACP